MRGVEVGEVLKLHPPALASSERGKARDAAWSAGRLEWGLARTLALPFEEGAAAEIRQVLSERGGTSRKRNTPVISP
jgi:hypothetical protein